MDRLKLEARRSGRSVPNPWRVEWDDCDHGGRREESNHGEPHVGQRCRKSGLTSYSHGRPSSFEFRCR